MDLSKLSTSDKIIAGSGLVLFIASFLPWFGISIEGFGSESGNGWDIGFLWAGIPALLGLAAAGIVLATRLGTAEAPRLPITWGQAFLAAGALSALLVVLKLLIGHEEVGFDLDREWGLYVAALAAIAFAIGGFLKFQEESTGRPSGPSV